MNVIITLGGTGDRLRAQGYTEPPALITGCGKTRFEWGMESLRTFFGENFFFITLKQHSLERFIRSKCEEYGIKKVTIIELSRPTAGQPVTIQAVKPHIDTREQMFVCSLTHSIDSTELHPLLFHGDGFIPCHRNDNKSDTPYTAFLKFEPSMRIFEIRERFRISEFATVGCFYFRSYEVFDKIYSRFQNPAARERLLSTIYSSLAEDASKSVFAYILNSYGVKPMFTRDQMNRLAVQPVQVA